MSWPGLSRSTAGPKPTADRRPPLGSADHRERMVGTVDVVGRPRTRVARPLREMAARSTLGPCPTRDRPSDSTAVSVGRWGIAPTPHDAYPYTARRRITRRLPVPSERRCAGRATAVRPTRLRQTLDASRQRQGEPSPCHFQLIAHRGACHKTRVTAQNRLPMPQPAEMRARRACVCCRRTGVAVMSNQRWDQRWDQPCSCG